MSASTNPIWAWNVRHSPIARRVRAHRHVAPLLAESGLPKPVQDRINAIVRKTRLWADERADVCRELIAHAQDAAHADQPVPAILESLGDPRPIAKLIRRSVKRKRGIIYQTRIWCTRALAASVLLTILAYGALTARFYAGSPNIRTDYTALLNEPLEQLADEDRAYLVYEDARIAWGVEEERLQDATLTADDDQPQPGVHLIPALPPEHPDHAMVTDAVRAFRPTLDAVAAATQRPALGRPYSPLGEHVETSGTKRWVTQPPPPKEDPDAWMINILLPDLGHTRALARLLAYDATLAAAETNADRTTHNLTALLDMSAQLGREPFLISGMVAIAIHELACQTTRQIAHEHPDLLERDHLIALSHTLARTRSTGLTLNYDTEAMFFDDFLQRAYTDDGAGDGRLTPEGFKLLTTIADDYQDFGPVPGEELGPAIAAVTPAYMALDQGRRAQHDAYHHYINLAREIDHAGPHRIGELDATLARALEIGGIPMRAQPVFSFLPALSQAVATRYRALASADATSALLAVLAHRRATGNLPESLEDLVPTLLPELPADPFDPGNPIKYARTNDTFTLYYAGADGDDDAGTPPPTDAPRAKTAAARVNDLARRYRPALNDEGRPYRTNDPDGDWVLYPPRAD